MDHPRVAKEIGYFPHMKKFIELFGWYGSAAILLAYALVSFSFLQPTSLTFHLLNATGALGIATDALSKKDYQPGVLNVVWVVIALVAMARMLVRV